jgi:hypothetical protein
MAKSLDAIAGAQSNTPNLQRSFKEVVARDSCSDNPPGQSASHAALRRLVVVLLVLLSVGEAHSRCAARPGILQPVHAREMEVRLCYARLPSVLRPVAAHAFSSRLRSAKAAMESMGSLAEQQPV